ncbi:MAG: ASPIC/UnbV domain-containing protein, partial [bacterium]
MDSIPADTAWAWDLYLTGFGRNQMFRNNGDGTFGDISSRSGTSDPSSWSVSASFVDVDRDGWLDLFVGNYLNYTLEAHTPCFNRSGPPDYCPPDVYRAQPSRFYRNRGDGTFVDVTAAAGLAREFGPALGVATADFNGDHWIDIFVANDQKENQLWINQQDGTFRNMALLWGVAVGANAELKADMGVDAGDFDNDGDEDLFITELTGQGSTLYVNTGTGLFEDQSARQGIRVPSLPYTGFGAAWIDFDNDGWLDIVAVNGYVTQNLEALGPDNPFPLQQRNQVFRNRRTGGFEEVTDRAGAVFQLSEVSRGAAFGDIDNDGDVDVLIGNAAGP